MSEDDTTYYWRKVLKLDEKPKEDAFKKFKYPHRFLRPLFFALYNLLAKYYFRIEIKGQENIPEKPPYIIAPNHCSAMDFPTVAWAMGKRVQDLYTITTKYFYDNPAARFFIKIATNSFRIDTKEDFFPALQAAAEILRRGKSIFIHPEGTRSPTGELLPFKVGVGVLAMELNVPIVPVYLSGTFEAMPTGAIFPKPVKVKVSFGKIITPESYEKLKQTEKPYYVYKEVTEELKRRILEMKAT